MGREEGLAAADRGDAVLRARGERGLLLNGDADGRGRERRGRLGAVRWRDADAERVLAGPDARANYFLTNVFLFHLQRHSDHHAWAKRRYQVLRHHEIAPQLPAGYAAMVVLAMIPPLWKKVMNPRVEAYYEGEEHQLA